MFKKSAHFSLHLLTRLLTQPPPKTEGTIWETAQLHAIFSDLMAIYDQSDAAGPARRFSILLDLPPSLAEIRVNRRALMTILRQGVNNAADAGAATVLMLVDASKEGFSISLVDDGKGISPGTLPRITEAGYTTNPKTNTGHGMGLILSYVQALGGQLTMKSQSDPANNRGTILTIELPLPEER